MIYTVFLRPEAEVDLRQAYQWYEEQRTGLGEDFILCTEATLSVIAENPLQFPLIYRETRRALVRRFPYGIFYVVDGQRISIVAIFHCRRNPQSLQTRSEK